LSTPANVIKAIFIKDLVSEFRTRQLLPAMVMLGVLIAWVFRIATQTDDKSVVAASVLLVALLFAAILASERSFAIEQHNDCISSLLLVPTDAGNIYLAKLLVNITMLCIFEIVIVPVALVLFNVDMAGRWLELVIVLLLVNIGITAIGTLLASMVQTVKSANCLLSVLMMAVLCPMMIPAVFALLLLFGSVGGNVAGTGVLAMVGNFKTAVGFLTAFDAIFVTICWLLFEFVVGQ